MNPVGTKTIAGSLGGLLLGGLVGGPVGAIVGLLAGGAGGNIFDPAADHAKGAPQFGVGSLVFIPAISLRKEGSETALGVDSSKAPQPTPQELVALAPAIDALTKGAVTRVPVRITTMNVSLPSDAPGTRAIGVIEFPGLTTRIPVSADFSNIFLTQT